MLGTTAEITGLPELDERLSYLADKSARRIGRAVAKKMVSVYARGIRKAIPQSIAPKTSDKGIGSRGMRSKGPRLYAAKAGIAVGQAGKNAAKFTTVNRGKHRGEGVTAKNLHWFALGTQDRFTGSKKSGDKRKKTGNRRRFTGKLDKSKWGGFVQKGVQASEASAKAQGQQLADRLIGDEEARARIGA